MPTINACLTGFDKLLQPCTYTMNRNGNFGLVFGWGKILLTYMIFAYHWTS